MDYPPDLLADLNEIIRIDREDRARSRASRIAIGAIWYRWKDNPLLSNARLTDLAPMLRFDRSYLQKCLNLFHWERTGHLATMERAMPDFDPQVSNEPYRSCAFHAEYQRRYSRKTKTHSDIGLTAPNPRDPLGGESTSARPTATFILGDCREELRKLPENYTNMLLMSPPYFGARNYMAGQPEHLREKEIGLESSVQEYIDALVTTLREGRRVLKPSGTAWIVIDDRYASGPTPGVRHVTLFNRNPSAPATRIPSQTAAKALMLIPDRLSIALAKDGWFVRMKLIWDKRGGAAPESARDRPHHMFEYILVLTKGPNYYWNQSVKTPAMTSASPRPYQAERGIDVSGQTMKSYVDVWSIKPPTGPKDSVHPARFPGELVRRALRLGCPPGGHVLDFFGGSGTTAVVAAQLGMHSTLIELNPDYMAEAKRKVAAVALPPSRFEPLVTSHGTIIHGDAVTELRKIDTGTAGMLLFDPPFGNNATLLPWDHALDWEPLWEEMWRVLPIDGSVVINCNARLLAKLIEMQPRTFRNIWHWWRRRHSNVMLGASQPKRHIEYVAVFNRSARAGYNPQMTPIPAPFTKVLRQIAAPFFGEKIALTQEREEWVTHELPVDLLFPRWEDGERIHGFATQKPVSLGRYMIETYCRPGDTVVDLTTGSGSYLVSAIRAGRRFIGIENDPKHFQIACDRIAALLGAENKNEPQADRSEVAD